ADDGAHRVTSEGVQVIDFPGDAGSQRAADVSSERLTEADTGTRVGHARRLWFEWHAFRRPAIEVLAGVAMAHGDEGGRVDTTEQEIRVEWQWHSRANDMQADGLRAVVVQAPDSGELVEQRTVRAHLD